MKAYLPPLSLWRLVEQHVPQHEHEEIKSMLGASLVEQSQELHEEIEMLLEIWREMRDENMENVSPQSTLPEPPDQRDRLVQEICFFVDNVKAKAKEKGIDPQLILKRHNSLVLDYAAELITRPESSAQGSSSLDGRETPLMSTVDNRENLSVEITDDVQAVNTKLNYLDFSEVCDNLRSTLEREVDQLMMDIQFLQSCLDNEADFRDSPASNLSREPTLSELREERSQLEKDLLVANKMTTTPHVVKPSFNLSSKVLLSTPLDSSASSSQTTRSSPLKADHGLIDTARCEYETVSSAPDTDKALHCQVKDARLLKSPIQPKQKTRSVSRSAVESDTCLDRNTKFSKSSHSRTGHESKFSSKETSLSSNRNAVGKNLRQLPGTKIPQNTEGYKQSFVSPTISVKKQDSAKLTMGVVRRSASPGRVRVVELTTVVGSRSIRDNNTLSDFSSTSTSPSATSPSPTSPSLSIDSPMRPHSAHADRFRKMVLGCRDGD